MLDVLRLAFGLVLLYFGAEWLVGGAAGLARSMGVSALLIGLTVVAYGTSAPEIVVGVQAALADHPDIALGNVVGSNIANIGLILGLTALVSPPRVDGVLPRREVPFLVATAAVVPVLLLDGQVAWWEGATLLAVAIIYTVWMVRASPRQVAEAHAAAGATARAADEAGAPSPTGSRARMAAIALAGLGGLVVGGDVFVGGATGVARTIGMSERLVGLTIVAVGTSLPELATSLIAARKGHSDIAVGNVIGSNIFNVLLCLGAAAALGSVGAPLATMQWDLAVLIGLTIAAAAMMRTARTISRREGAFLVAAYVAYITLLAVRG